MAGILVLTVFALLLDARGRADRAAPDALAAGGGRDREALDEETGAWPRTSRRWRTATAPANPSIHDVSDPARRVVLRGGLGAAAARAAAGAAWLVRLRRRRRRRRPRPGRASASRAVPASAADRARRARRATSPTSFAPGASRSASPATMPAFRDDAGNSADEQAVQMGMHHDGIHYYPARRQPARPAGDEPRVHRRRPAASRRHDDLERREGEEGAGGARRLGDRGRAGSGEPLADGAAVALRAPLHRRHAVRGRRPGRRPCADADRGRPGRPAPCSARSTTAPAA